MNEPREKERERERKGPGKKRVGLFISPAAMDIQFNWWLRHGD